MRVLLIAAAAAALAGCSNDGRFNSSGFFGVDPADRPVHVKSPTGNQINGFLKKFSDFNGIKIQTGTDYVFSGFAYVDYHCENYFVALEQRRRRIALRKDVINQTVTQSVGILISLSKTLAASYVNAGGAVASQFFNSYDRNYNYSNHSIELRRLTQEAQSKIKNDFLGESEKDYQGSINNVTTLMKSHNVVQVYATQCTPAQFESFISSALSGTTARQSTEESSQSNKRNNRPLATPQVKSVIASPPFVATPRRF